MARVRGGYRIHDFHDWNKTAGEIKEKRVKERERVRKYRARKGESRPPFPSFSTDWTRTCTSVPAGSCTTTSTVQVQGTSSAAAPPPVENPKPGTLKALVVAEVAACQRAGQLTLPTVLMAVKAALVRSHFSADPTWTASAIAEALQQARAAVTRFGTVPLSRRRRS